MRRRTVNTRRENAGVSTFACHVLLMLVPSSESVQCGVCCRRASAVSRPRGFPPCSHGSHFLKESASPTTQRCCATACCTEADPFVTVTPSRPDAVAAKFLADDCFATNAGNDAGGKLRGEIRRRIERARRMFLRCLQRNKCLQIVFASKQMLANRRVEQNAGLMQSKRCEMDGEAESAILL